MVTDSRLERFVCEFDDRVLAMEYADFKNQQEDKEQQQ